MTHKEEYEKKDPRGLVQNDLKHLRDIFPVRPVTPKTSINSIMFEAGRQNIIDYIESHMVARR